MYYLPKQTDEKHDFAFSEAHGGDIHISKATKSGRLDYACLGCKKPMQAILRKLYGAKPYFRHDTKDVAPGERCTFRDEDYRRKLALTTVELEKMLYVPPLHKFPPKGVDGPIIPLAGGQLIYAARVSKYQYFYEDGEGNVKIAAAFDPDKGNLLFFADLVLYDDEDLPVVLATLHRPKKKYMSEIQAALARLRINTLYLTIPQESPEAIRRSLMNGKNVKWLYHEDERQFDYLSLSAGFTGGVPATDADQGQLFEESFDCRKVQINNLIRAVNRCLASEPYHTAERGVKAAVGQTQLAISRAEERRAAIEERHRTQLEEQHQREFDRIGQRRSVLELAFDDLRERKTSLEARYRAKNSELETKGRTVAAELRAAALAIGGAGSTIEELEDDLTRTDDQEIERMGKAFGTGIKFVQFETKRIVDRIADACANHDRLRKVLEGMPDEFRKIQAEEEKRFNEEEQFEDNETGRIEAAGIQRPAAIAAAQRQIDADFDTKYNGRNAGLPKDLITSYLTDPSALPLKHIAIVSDSVKLKSFLTRRLSKLGYPNISVDELMLAANSFQ